MVGCAAFRCSNRSEKGFLMRYFPRNPQRRKLWTDRVRRKDWKPTNNSVLCELHFEPKMWKKKRGIRILRQNAIPTIFNFKPKGNVTRKNWVDKCRKNLISNTTNISCPNGAMDTAVNIPLNLNNPQTAELLSAAQIAKIEHNYAGEKPLELDIPKCEPGCDEAPPKSIVFVSVGTDYNVPSSIGNSNSALSDTAVNYNMVKETLGPNVIPNEDSDSSDSDNITDTDNDADTDTDSDTDTYTYSDTDSDSDDSSNSCTSHSSLSLSDIEWKDTEEKKQKVYEKKLEMCNAKHLKLLLHHKVLKKKLRSQKRLCYRLKKKLEKITQTNYHVEYYKVLRTVFNDDQICAIKGSMKFVKWSDDTIDKALRIKQICGIKGYNELLRQKLPLPSFKTLNRRLKDDQDNNE